MGEINQAFFKYIDKKCVLILTVKRFEANPTLESAPVKFEKLGAGEPEPLLPDSWLSTEPEVGSGGLWAILCDNKVDRDHQILRPTVGLRRFVMKRDRPATTGMIIFTFFPSYYYYCTLGIMICIASCNCYVIHSFDEATFYQPLLLDNAWFYALLYYTDNNCWWRLHATSLSGHSTSTTTTNTRTPLCYSYCCRYLVFNLSQRPRRSHQHNKTQAKIRWYYDGGAVADMNYCCCWY